MAMADGRGTSDQMQDPRNVGYVCRAPGQGAAPGFIMDSVRGERLPGGWCTAGQVLVCIASPQRPDEGWRRLHSRDPQI